MSESTLATALVAPFDSRVVAEGDILRFSDGRGAVQVLAEPSRGWQRVRPGSCG